MRFMARGMMRKNVISHNLHRKWVRALKPVERGELAAQEAEVAHGSLSTQFSNVRPAT